ncbi:hypothetical protein NPIL_259451 [Nephila pilipes]|uniref:Uncharacterized protein n=1 Tax=Nephila pilipes TaxID=299642 RepID=A0A8X6QY99_NEPPI|nr:hypothetical protein NPIL_259451 [Nephila pilipes]
MATVLIDCESVINSRLLTHVSEHELTTDFYPCSYKMSARHVPDIVTMEQGPLNRRLKYRQDTEEFTKRPYVRYARQNKKKAWLQCVGSKYALYSQQRYAAFLAKALRMPVYFSKEGAFCLLAFAWLRKRQKRLHTVLQCAVVVRRGKKMRMAKCFIVCLIFDIRI